MREGNGDLKSLRGLALALLLALLGAGCAGDGRESQGAVPLEATLASLQENIFTPICAATGCHAGQGAPLGLRLDEASASFENLVGVPSVERPDLQLSRVVPGQPEQSYLVWKIEGRQGIEGQQMPLGQPPLSSEQAAALVQWISDGAPQS
jgi:hypothetical protein